MYNNPTRFRSYAVKFNFYFAFISIKYGYMSFLWVQSLGWFASKSSKTMVWWILPNRSSVALKKSNLDLNCNLLNSFCMYVVYILNCSRKNTFHSTDSEIAYNHLNFVVGDRRVSIFWLDNLCSLCFFVIILI